MLIRRRGKLFRAFIAGCGLCALSAAAMTDADLTARLETAVRGDRTGVCVVAAVIEGPQVARGRTCAAPRPGGGPGFDAAFEIGSVTKTMTAFLVADLMEAGRWSLDDPIAKHLPPGTAVPRQGERQILVRDIVTHSSGLPGLPPSFRPRDPGNPYADLTRAGLLAALGEVTLTRPIGSRAEYSNFAMMLLSLAVADAHAAEFGGDFEKLLAARLFEPLKMTGAYIARPPAGVRPAQGHLPWGAPTPAWTWAAAPNAAGVGGVRARLDDLVRYAQAHLGLIDTPLAARLRATQQAVAHGAGINWARLSVQGHGLLLHLGGTGGFSSIVVLEPEQQRAVVVLADTALTDLGGLGPLAFALMGLNLPLPRPRLETPVPAALLAAMPGDYVLAGMALKVWEEAGGLTAQAAGQPPLALRHDDHGDLYPVGVSALLTPVLEAGVVTHFTWRQGGGVLQGVRTGGVQPAATAQNPLWRPWAGEYRLAPAFSLRIFEAAGRLMVQGTGQPPLAAEVVGKDRIELAVVGASIEFQRNEQGEVVSLTLRQNGQVLQGPRQAGP
jgi:CubicO group peptidase (beta-lactamase class C family)